MPFSANFGLVNIIGSFNNYFDTNLTASGLPTWISAINAYYDFPQQGLTAFPSVSVTHLGQVYQPAAEGNRVDGGSAGHWVNGIADISCWASEKNYDNSFNNSAQIQLLSMRDMVMQMFKYGTAISILNIYASTASPASLGAIIRVSNMQEDTPMVDAVNPAIRRRRILVTYRYIERR